MTLVDFISEYYPCIILAVFGITGYIWYLKQQIRDICAQLSDKNDKYNTLYREYKKLLDEKTKNELAENRDEPD